MGTTRRLFKCFRFEKAALGSISFSDTSKITMDAANSLVQLKSFNGLYGAEFPQDDDIYVETPTMAAGALLNWLLIQAFYTNVTDDDQVVQTDVQMRLHDGAAHLYWDGAAWSAAGPGDWNSQLEVDANLSDWGVDPIGFVFNLVSSDGRFTPTVSLIKVMYEVELLSFLNDWLYSTVIADLQDNLRPLSDFVITKGATSSTIDLNDFPFEGNWDLVDVDGVWNEDTDPTHQSDLLVSYNGGSKVVTLSAPLTAGVKVLIRFLYRVPISVQTNQDFREIAQSPQVVFEDINLVDFGEAPTFDFILNNFVDPPEGVILPAPRRHNIVFTLTVDAPTGVDLNRLTEAVAAFLQARRTITSFATGEDATLRIIDPFTSAGGPNHSDINEASVTFQLENVYFWHREAFSVGDTAAAAAAGINPSYLYGIKQVIADLQIAT